MPNNRREKIQDVVLILRLPLTLRDAAKKLAAKRLTSVASIVRKALLAEVKRG